MRSAIEIAVGEENAQVKAAEAREVQDANVNRSVAPLKMSVAREANTGTVVIGGIQRRIGTRASHHQLQHGI
tara:strand:+ start:115 stop:330 length:216 start_codon:yes stop_codon:yes gene_type:complete